MTIRRFHTLPDIVGGHPLSHFIGVIIPIARTNALTNPSAELNNTNYSPISAVQNTITGISYHGLNSISYTLTSATTDGGFYGPVSLTSGVTYVFSLKFYDPVPNRPYKISFATTGGVDLSVYPFKSTGRWQWLWVFYKETSTTTRRLYFTKNSSAHTGTIYVDGLQLEDLSDGVLSPSTYIDGDQQGLLTGQSPAPYAWNGTPHASTSYRTALTRAGGYVMDIKKYGFLLTGLFGLDMAVPNNVSIPYTVLDGARYQRTTKPPRTFSFTGRFQASTRAQLDRLRSDMRAVLDRDLVPLQQPMLLMIEPRDDCGVASGDFATVPCVYAGGLEGSDTSALAEDAAPTFTMYTSFLTSGDAGASLTVQTSVSNANAILKRATNGTWSALATGMGGVGANGVEAILAHTNGTIYCGGTFTSAGASGADNMASYDPATNTFTNIASSDTTFNAAVRSLAQHPDGRVVISGAFTNASGIAAADFICVLNPTTNTIAALGTGANADITVCAVDQSGRIFGGGLSTTDLGGVANTNGIGYWDGAAWNAMNIGITNNAVTSILPVGNRIYIGGTFTGVSGVANTSRLAYWSFADNAWHSVTSSPPVVAAGVWLFRLSNGNLLITGDFTSIGGVNATGAAIYNGSSFFPVGSANAFDAQPRAAAQLQDGTTWLSGDFTQIEGVSISSPLARMLGSKAGAVVVPPDVDLPGSPGVYGLAKGRDDVLYAGFSTTGTATAAGITSVSNTTPSFVWPRLVIKGPSSGTSRIYQILNYTTGFAIYLNYTINAGETATFITDPANPSFTSDIFGDLTSKILPGSSPARFYLAPGANSISFFAASSSVTATLSWQRRYNGINDLVQ